MSADHVDTDRVGAQTGTVTGKTLSSVKSPPEVAHSGQVREQPWSLGAILVRVGAVVSLLLAGSATWVGGAAPPLLLVLGIVALGGVAALRPDSPAGAIVLLFVLWWWTVADTEIWHVGAVIALPCLVAAHAMLTVAALTPPFLPLASDVLWLWARRAAALSAAGGAVLAVGWLSSRSGVGWAVAAAALLATLGTALALAVLYPKDDALT